MPNLIRVLAGILLFASAIIGHAGGAGEHIPAFGIQFQVRGKTESVADIALLEMENTIRRELSLRHIDVDEFSRMDGKLSFAVRDPSQIDAAVEITKQQSTVAASSGKYATFLGHDFWVVGVAKPSRITLSPTNALLDSAADSAMIEVRDALARRLVGLGGLAQAKRTAADRILLEIQGHTDIRRLRAIIARPARLRLSLADHTVLPAQLASGSVPIGSEILIDAQNRRVAVSRRTLIDNGQVRDASEAVDARTGRPAVAIHLDEAGAQRLANITSENIGRSLAVILDNVVVAMPVIDRPISNGAVQITGGFSREDAADIAASLRSGPLPIAVTIIEERVVKR